MPRCLLLMVVVAGVGGCFVPYTVTSQTPAPAKAPAAPPPVIQPPPHVESPRVEITPAAKKKIQEYMEIEPSQSFVLVSVEFDDEKSCTGKSYHLRLGTEEHCDDYHLIESDGLQVGLEKNHLSFLNGLQIHWLQISDEIAGFHFINPNDKNDDSKPQATDNSAPPASQIE